MNAKLTLGYDPINLVDSDLRSIVHFQGRTRAETTIINTENNGIEKPLIGVVERAVDENAAIVVGSAYSRCLYGQV